MTTDGRLSGAHTNELVDAIVAKAMDVYQQLTDQFMASGYPPFTEPNTPYEQYQKLLAMRAVNDPNFVYNQKAQQTLQLLSLRFGVPPPLETPGGTVPANPGQIAQQLQYVQGGPQ